MHFAKGVVVLVWMLSKMKTPTVKVEKEEVVDEVPNLLPPLGCFLSSSYSSFALSTT